LSDEPLHGRRAGWGIEINHHISAENYVLFREHRILGLEEIDSLEAYVILNFTFDSAGAGSYTNAFLKIAPQQFLWHGLDGIHLIDALLSVAKHAP
jgi:hypothetical protein